MMSKAYKTVVFDLGGVLVDWNPAYVYRTIFKTEDSVRYFLKHICTTAWNEEQDAGRTFAEATDVLVQQFPHFSFEIRQYYNRWTEMLGGPIGPTVSFLEELHKTGLFRLVALTNWSAESFPVALQKFDFLQSFDKILVSGEEKLKKPDVRIFHLMYEKFAIDPSNALFIDDNAMNVLASQSTGMDAVHFTDPVASISRIRQLLSVI